MNDFQASLQANYEEMVAWRRYLHQHPELSFHEYRTAEFVANHLQSWDIEVRTNVGGNGIVGLLRGSSEGPTVALRADMDALPIQDEKMNCAYASLTKGVMHACGHDAHTATLLSIAKVASQHRSQLKGNLVFLFQHAEEITPGGADSMIQHGALEGVDAVFGVHLWTPFPVGHFYSKAGPLMAAPDEFTIHIQGKGGHGGLPHQTIDSIYVASQLVVNLQSIVSRQVDPIEPCVVSVGSFHGGSSFNVIAETSVLNGTVRTFNAELRQDVKERLERIVHATCEMYQASYKINYKLGYPTVVNDGKEAERFFKVGTELFGAEAVHESPLIMAGEDFSYYLNHRPGCFMFVGAGNVEAGIVHPHHHPKFDIDEKSMLNAANLLLGMALDYMA
ncbi:M20 family metallopeptidase [Paenibacillus alginolyticus]|uniref:M20 family metallopeptidase n=1 Tax=Paenibacillus alginolyticus TaxID=59839 RepID=A0ABT4GJA5_9BACL|nr:M20 family metallopeptidase [Paenibacillus alginolyticus]MCY9696287.1 M20 family metallopeptidase [Paenibacillus alginolyticus]MEC0142562.1 M20 family metallopeptidase [Paenibacillus alginolyticus]